MNDCEYMKIKHSEIPPDIITHYQLDRIAHHDRYVYIEIRKGMPVLKQAGKIDNNRLEAHLEKYGYVPCNCTPSLWKHKTQNITFALAVDDFGVKYVGKELQPSRIDVKRPVQNHS